jgi:hypothetical protein
VALEVVVFLLSFSPFRAAAAAVAAVAMPQN